jgi:dihydrolipoamide dehydrogenase
MNSEFDVVVLGGGPGGNIAAITAGQLGAKTTLVEKEHLGGVCLNRGCIPTKFFLESAALFKEIKSAQNFGINVSPAQIDLVVLQEKKNKIVQRLRDGVETMVKNNKVELLFGQGTAIDPQTVEVSLGEERHTLKTKKIILATGSQPSIPQVFKIADANIITSDDALELKEIPENIVIVGGGAVGVEFASIFHNFGAKVTIIEMLPRLLPEADKEIGLTLEQLFKRQGIKVIAGQKVEKIDRKEGKLNVSVTDGNSFIAEKILLAASRTPNTASFKSLNLKPNGNFVEVDEQMRTSIENVFAVGDILGKYQLASTASVEGITAAETACGKIAKINYQIIPFCVFSIPQAAWVGLTEEQALKKYASIKIKKFLFRALGKAHVIDKIDGFFKIVADENDKILGVHILGHLAAELIAEAAVAIKAGFTTQQLAAIIHAHPTLYEGLMETASLF